MTTATLVAGNRTTDTVDRPRRSLEELVDRLIDALFTANTETEESSATRSIHEARRLRQSGDVDTALAVLGSVNVTQATPREARWAFSEWKQMVRRRFGGGKIMLYKPGHGKGVRAGSPGRRDDGGRRGVGYALAARQGRLGAQPAGASAPGECLPSALTVEWPGAGVAQATVDDS